MFSAFLETEQKDPVPGRRVGANPRVICWGGVRGTNPKADRAEAPFS